MGRVLIVEDEPRMRGLLAEVLAGDGHETRTAADGTTGLAIVAGGGVDAAVVDVMLPGMDGFELCRHLRRYELDVGVLLLTARSDLDDRVSGLDAGADDYLTKPFETAELRARVRALLRRSQRTTGPVAVGGLEIDTAATRVRCGGRPLALTAKEFAVLRVLAAHLGAPVSRSALLTEVWGETDPVLPTVVDQYVSHLRRRLSAEKTGVRIASVRGVGYRLDAIR